MPIGTRANMRVYDPRVQGAYRERNAQVIEAFNEASNNSIRLTSAGRVGDYDIQAFFRRLSAGVVQRRVDTDVSAVADTEFQQDEQAAVKMKRRVGPLAVTADALRNIGANLDADSDVEDVFLTAAGDSLSEIATEDKLNSTLAALSAAIRNNANMLNDLSADTTGVTSARLNSTLFKRGDRQTDIVAWVMHSSKLAQLTDQQIATNATGVTSVVLAGGSPLTFNRPVLVTDSPSLIVTGTPNKFVTLGLVADAAVVEDTEEELFVADWQPGFGNIILRMQGEHAYNLKMQGFTWDVANGGANPTAAALGTGSNWDLIVQSHKNGPGVALLTQ